MATDRFGTAARARLLICLPLLIFAITTSARPGTALNQNGTIADDADDAKLYCDKTKWHDVFWFFFTNYILHALSVRSLPGETFFSSTVFKFCCLLVPYTGVRRGLCLISRASNLSSDDLQAAARANALCFIVRRPDWRPIDGDNAIGHLVVDGDNSSLEKALRGDAKPQWKHLPEKPAFEGLHLHVKDLYRPSVSPSTFDRFTRWLIETHRFKDHEPNLGGAVDLNTVKLQGYCKLAPGFGVAYVPSDIKVYPRQEPNGNHRPFYRFNPFDATNETKIASTHDVPRILFSLVQTISGGYAIYKARGSQIDHYGFAAFGLTVVPYMVVSVINFLGSLLTSEYETIYMVHSSTMDEMIARGGHIDGAVGSLEEPIGEGLRPSETRETAEGDRISFYEDEGLFCRGPQQGDNDGEYNHRILPCEPETKPAKLSWTRWLLRGYFWLRARARGRTPQRPQLKTPCILVPSQSSFTRLPEQKARPYLDLLALILLFIALAAPYAAMGILSGFRANRSTSTQRSCVLTWLIAGQVQGYAVNHVERHMDRKAALKGFFIVFISYGANCLLGLVIVAQEMVEFGTCKSLD